MDNVTRAVVIMLVVTFALIGAVSAVVVTAGMWLGFELVYCIALSGIVAVALTEVKFMRDKLTNTVLSTLNKYQEN